MAQREITFSVGEDTLQALDLLVNESHSDRDTVLNDAVSSYLSLHELHRELIEEGIRQDDAEDVIDHAEVRRTASAWAGEAPRR